MAKPLTLTTATYRTSPVRGDSLRITIDPLKSVPLGSGGIQKAWLTFKESKSDPDADAYLQKIITEVATIDGWISDIGLDTFASLYFDLSPSDTLLFPAERSIHVDIQVQTGGGQIHTPVLGQIKFTEGVTTAPN